MEAGVVIDKNLSPIHWHLPPGRTGGSLPDSRNLWDVIWENRDIVQGFAHSHPGSGAPAPSGTDLSTFVAVEAALGRRLDWWITSSDRLLILHHTEDALPPWGKHTHRSRQGTETIYLGMVIAPEPDWAAELRRLSA